MYWLYSYILDLLSTQFNKLSFHTILKSILTICTFPSVNTALVFFLVVWTLFDTEFTWIRNTSSFYIETYNRLWKLLVDMALYFGHRKHSFLKNFKCLQNKMPHEDWGLFTAFRCDHNLSHGTKIVFECLNRKY